MPDCLDCKVPMIEGIKTLSFISDAQTFEIEKEDAYYCEQCQNTVSKQEAELDDDNNAYLYLSAREAVNRLYKKILGREADAGGLKHYSEQLESEKLDIAELRRVLLNSEEYKNKPINVENDTTDVDDMIIRL